MAKKEEKKKKVKKKVSILLMVEDMMDDLDCILELAEKFDNGIMSSSSKVRKVMQEVKTKAQDVRVSIQTVVNENKEAKETEKVEASKKEKKKKKKGGKKSKKK